MVVFHVLDYTYITIQQELDSSSIDTYRIIMLEDFIEVISPNLCKPAELISAFLQNKTKPSKRMTIVYILLYGVYNFMVVFH